MYVTMSTKNAADYEPVKVDSMADVADIAVTQPRQNWSCGIFKDNYRNLENFHKAYFIGLDIDGGMTLDEAKKAFRDYQHCIVTSKSHQVEKGGVIADRFRVVLKLTEPIKDSDHFYSTWFKLKDEYPALDPACKDASRMWYTGNEIVVVKETGKTIDVCKEKIERRDLEYLEDTGDYGKLSKLTNNFLEFGAEDLWNMRLFKAAKDMQEQGYSKEHAVQKLQRAALNFEGSLNEEDLKTIDSAYKNAPKHNRRRGAFVWETVDELTDSDEVVWLIEGVLSLGGLGTIAGKPGLGKSTLTRQIAMCVCTGKDFLGRKTLKGGVLHITLEESRQILKSEAKIQGLADQENYFLHLNQVDIMNNISELEQHIVDKQAKLLIIDSLFYAAAGLDVNNSSDMNKFYQPLQYLADRSNCSILIVHHQNKGGEGQDSVMGSTAITSKGEMVMLFEGNGEARFINMTKSRAGNKFRNQRLYYNPDTRWLELTEGASRKSGKKKKVWDDDL